MRLTAKSHYAILLIADIANQASITKPRRIASAAYTQKIPAPYASQIVWKLRKAGLIQTITGSGALLAKAPEEITLLDIVQAVGENTRPASENAPLTTKERESLYHTSVLLNDYIEVLLASVSLDEMIQELNPEK